jgi:ribosomal protein S18 acetylase RimI-like enzyme
MEAADSSTAHPQEGSPRFRYLAGQPGEPTAETIQSLAPWIIDASRPFADWYFGEPWAAAELITEWMSRSTSEVFAGRAILHEDASGPSGCILALPGSLLAQCRAADFAAFSREVAGEPGADDVLAEIIVVSNELFGRVESDDLYVSRVGVDPQQRGRGIGQAMLSHVLDLGARRGHPRVRLDVSADNVPALRTYGAVGFERHGTRHSAVAGLTYHSMVAFL